MILFTVFLWLTGCSSTLENASPLKESQFQSLHEDPLEPMNRVVFKFNTIVDGVLINPFTRLYQDNAPNWMQKSIRNILKNLYQPLSGINSLLQGRVDNFIETFFRFIVNTLLGLGGIFEVADSMEIPEHKEDFSRTLLVWGFSAGPYLVLPIIGPSSFASTVGLGVDVMLDPYTYSFKRKWPLYTRSGLNAFTLKALHQKDIDSLQETSLDYYAAVRSFYYQHYRAELGFPSVAEQGPESFAEDESFFS